MEQVVVDTVAVPAEAEAARGGEVDAADIDDIDTLTERPLADVVARLSVYTLIRTNNARSAHKLVETISIIINFPIPVVFVFFFVVSTSFLCKYPCRSYHRAMRTALLFH